MTEATISSSSSPVPKRRWKVALWAVDTSGYSAVVKVEASSKDEAIEAAFALDDDLRENDKYQFENCGNRDVYVDSVTPLPDGSGE
jgi:hypothetical protein